MGNAVLAIHPYFRAYAPPDPGGFMHRKRKLIDRRFQLKTTFRIIGSIIIAFITLIAITGIYTLNADNQIETILHEMSVSIESQKAILENTVSASPRDNASEEVRERVRTIAVMKKNVVLLGDISRHNRILMTAILGVGLILGLFLYFYLIELTHRISGPLHVLSTLVKNALDGKETNVRPLRKNDEFKEFYEQVADLIARSKR